MLNIYLNSSEIFRTDKVKQKAWDTCKISWNGFASPFGFILRILKHLRYTHSWKKCLLRKPVLCVWNAALQGAEYFYYFGTQSFAAEFGLQAMQFSFARLFLSSEPNDP